MRLCLGARAVTGGVFMAMQVEAKRAAEHISGVSNVTFDLLTVLENKLQGIAAMEEYKVDCQDSGDEPARTLLEDLQRRGVEDVERLRGYLRDRL
jgi:hypothetical protein